MKTEKTVEIDFETEETKEGEEITKWRSLSSQGIFNECSYCMAKWIQQEVRMYPDPTDLEKSLLGNVKGRYCYE